MTVDEIPDIVVGRLPVYLRALTHMAASGREDMTSSYELGRKLGISSAQIRKDLSHFGEFGKQGTGYHINYLIEQIRHILHLEKEWPVALVGVGYLGHALVHYQGFENHGFQIRWVFDNDRTVVGNEVNGLKVRHIRGMESLIEREHVQVAILAVPAASAQKIADRLVKAGIKSILSYAPINLDAPPGVQVRYSDPVVQLQHMAYYQEP